VIKTGVGAPDQWMARIDCRRVVLVGTALLVCYRSGGFADVIVGHAFASHRFIMRFKQACDLHSRAAAAACAVRLRGASFPRACSFTSCQVRGIACRDPRTARRWSPRLSAAISTAVQDPDGFRATDTGSAGAFLRGKASAPDFKVEKSRRRPSSSGSVSAFSQNGSSGVQSAS
jgi:hypothetical protein